MPLRVLIDTDVLLDVALERAPFVEDSVAVLNWAEINPGSAFVAWHSISNHYYVGKSIRSDEVIRDFLHELLGVVSVPPGAVDAARSALALPLDDFEDAMQVAAGLSVRVDLIVTRNVADFHGSPVPAVTPPGMLRRVRV